jgi:pimeloyl-ACP methyl ester carboxylesterase
VVSIRCSISELNKIINYDKIYGMQRTFLSTLTLALLMIILGCSQGTDQLKRETLTVELKSSTIEYFSRGKGKIIVLLPGGGMNVEYMESLSKEIALEGYRVISVNPRGAGASTNRSASASLHDLSDDVAGVIRQLNNGPVTIVGHAFGNRVARMLASDHPELVNKVVLLAAGGKVSPTPEASEAMKIIFDSKTSEEAFLKSMTYMVGDPKDAKMAGEILNFSRAPNAGPIQYAAAASSKIEDWWAPVGKSKFLILQGNRDQAAPPKNGYLLKEDLADRAILVSIEGAGHLMLITQPEKCAQEII